MTDLHGLQETHVFINRQLDAILESIPQFRIERHQADDELVIVVLGRRGVPLLGLLQDSETPSWTQLLMTTGNDIPAMVAPLRRIGVAPELLDVMKTFDGDPLLDLDALRNAVAYPFPDDPNAEVCAITGNRAYASVHKDAPELSGWFGSTIADATHFAVVDRTLPIGPLCDDEIRKALDAGRIAEIRPIDASELKTLSDELVAAQLEIGIAITERLILQHDARDFPFGNGRVIREDDDMLAQPFAGFVQGRTTNGKIDLVSLGRLMALVARARAKPLLPGPARLEAISKGIARLKHDPSDDLLLETLAGSAR